MHWGRQRAQELALGELCVQLQPSRMEPPHGLLDEVPREHQLLQKPVRVVVVGARPSWGPSSLWQAAGGDSAPQPSSPARPG